MHYMSRRHAVPDGHALLIHGHVHAREPIARVGVCFYRVSVFMQACTNRWKVGRSRCRQCGDALQAVPLVVRDGELHGAPHQRCAARPGDQDPAVGGRYMFLAWVLRPGLVRMVETPRIGRWPLYVQESECWMVNTSQGEMHAAPRHRARPSGSTQRRCIN